MAAMLANGEPGLGCETSAPTITVGLELGKYVLPGEFQGGMVRDVMPPSFALIFSATLEQYCGLACLTEFALSTCEPTPKRQSALFLSLS